MKPIKLILIFSFLPLFVFSQTNKISKSDSLNIGMSVNYSLAKDTLYISNICNNQSCSTNKDTPSLSIDYLKSKWIEIFGIIIAILGLVIAVFAFIIPIYSYLGKKKEEQRDNRFRTYHQLIKELVQADETGKIMLDRQIAIAYELRNFPTYFDLTHRILKDLKEIWEVKKDENKRIIRELDLTIEFIEKKTKRKKDKK